MKLSLPPKLILAVAKKKLIFYSRCENGLVKVKIIVNWSVRKTKTFENNYSQGRSRMGMPLWYLKPKAHIEK
jgi:hypothetical protein